MVSTNLLQKIKAHLADGLAKRGGLICSGGALAWLRDVLSYTTLPLE